MKRSDGTRLAPAYRLRLIAGFSVVIALVAGGWAWSLSAPVTDAVTEQQRQRLTDLARAGALLVEHGDLRLDESAAKLAGDSGVRTTIIAADGTVLADSDEDPAALENHGDRPEVRSALAGEVGTDIRRSDTQGIEQMYVAVLAIANGQRVVLRVSEPLSLIAELSASARRSGVLLLGIVVVLAAGMVWALTRSAAEPVERLAEAARTMADGDLTTPVPEQPGPLASLSNALGRLRVQLRDRLDELEGEERTLRLALDGLADAVVLLDGDTVVQANRSLRTMFRTPPGQLRGRHLAELSLPAPIQALIEARVETVEPTSVEVGPDPFRRYHRVLVVPLGSGDGSRRVLAVVSDISERKRLDAVRRDFVANASHELKTPTAAILLLAESAAAAAEDGDADQSAVFLAQISAEAQRLKRLVSDLLDLSRLETAPTSDDVADVRHALEMALTGHRRAASQKGLVLASDLDAVAGMDVAVSCGATDLAIALDNLLSNAIAYTESGNVTIAVEADEQTVTITVSDTGIGIPPEDVERVFERFYRVDRARSRGSGGTGLGLALVRNVAERAGGSATIESRSGEGTSVRLRLPRAT